MELGAITDVREIRRHQRSPSVSLTQEADEARQGPAHIALVDPDGSEILIDQHVRSNGRVCRTRSTRSMDRPGT